MAIRDPRLLDFVARDLAFLLRTHRTCHPRIQRLLYRLVIQYGEFLSTQSQVAILDALRSRSCQRTGSISDLIPQNGLSDVVLDDCITDATTISRSLSTALFNTAAYLPNDSIGRLFSVFSPAYALPLRWSSLVLFSIFNSSGMLHFNEANCTNDDAISQMTSCWHVIFGLATAENFIPRNPSSSHAMQPTTTGVLEATHALYRLWLPIVQSCTVSQDLACAVAISFLRIASILADAALFHDCQVLCQAESGPQGPRTSLQKLLAAQYIAAALRVQGSVSDVVLRALETFSLDSKQQHQVLATAVEALAPIDAPLAHTLYTVAQEMGMGLGLGVTYTLAVSFARTGALRQAIVFLASGQFSQEKQGILISAIARSLRENPRTRQPLSVYAAIVDALAASYHSHAPPKHFRGHLEQLSVILAQHGRGSQLFPVVLSILKRSPCFFQPRFFVRYCHMLIRHKQFSTARKLFDAIKVVHPNTARSLRVLTDRIAVQTKAFRGSKRTTLFRSPISLRLSSRLRRRPCIGPALEISLQELLDSGRVLAAKRVFTCAAATISSRQCTALGNILLHGVSRQPTSRNGRRVRKILALLENLVKVHGFRPDRVTANILIKVMINWRSAFDSPRLRELFDQVVRGGYSAAHHPLHPPFSTRRTRFSGSPGFSKLTSFVSFEKHTRPLFKMFIKAFYLCNDVEAARKVVGILKVEEHKNAVAKEVRRKARSKGRVEADKRNAIALDATVSSND